MNPSEIVEGLVIYFTWLAPARDGLPGSAVTVEFQITEIDGDTVNGMAKFSSRADAKLHERSWVKADVAKLGRLEP